MTSNTPRQSISIQEFCNANGLSRSNFYNMLKEGRAPRFVKVGRLTRIPIAEALAWEKRLLAASAEVHA